VCVCVCVCVCVLWLLLSRAQTASFLLRVMSFVAYVYHICPLHLINATIFGEKNVFSIKCVFLFSLQPCLNLFSFGEEFSETLQ
jgi:hypothetical protein